LEHFQAHCKNSVSSSIEIGLALKGPWYRVSLSVPFQRESKPKQRKAWEEQRKTWEKQQRGLELKKGLAELAKAEKKKRKFLRQERVILQGIVKRLESFGYLTPAGCHQRLRNERERMASLNMSVDNLSAWECWILIWLTARLSN
jgi:hypothetical protein